MATGDIDRGPTGQRVAELVRLRREELRLTLNEVADRLAAQGRPILPSGLSKLERGVRRVDVDDLMALAIALETTPNQLLLEPGEDDDESPTYLTPGTKMSFGAAWRWANGYLPLPSIPVDEAIRYADALRPITEAIRAALTQGVPAGTVHAWAERVPWEEALRGLTGPDDAS